MAGVKPIHHDPRKIDQLNRELYVAAAIGAFKGALIGISTGLGLRLISKTYRHVRTPVRVFYHVAWITTGAAFWSEKQVYSFEERVYAEESRRRSRILDEAADRGVFLEDDERNLDDGLHRPEVLTEMEK